MDHLFLKGFRNRNWRWQNWNEFQHLCSTCLHHSVMNDADDPMSLFTSILNDIAEETSSKTSAVPKRLNKLWFSATGPLIGSNTNQPRVT